MYEKCNYQNMQMCDKARDEGIITFGHTIRGGFAATIVGSGKIDFCPYCGESLKEPKIVMISGTPYGRSPVMEMIERGFLASPIMPYSGGEEEETDIQIRRWPFDWRGMSFSQCKNFQKFKEHIDNLKSERDKLPGYAQDSLDAILNGYICGVGMASGPDVSVIDGVVQE